MNEEEYLKKRLEDQINWYDKKSIFNQKCYKILRITEIVTAAVIPFFAGFVYLNSYLLKIVLGLLGVIIVIITGVVSLYKFQENWIEFRTTCETLKHEKFLFLTASEPYNLEKPFQLLVQRIENLISKENTKWLEYINISKEVKSKN